jgi:hypothetical protein
MAMIATTFSLKSGRGHPMNKAKVLPKRIGYSLIAVWVHLVEVDVLDNNR